MVRIPLTGRNAFRGPGAWNFDAAVTKQFSLTERFKLEFREEGFDIFNHHNFYINALSLDVPNFGGNPIVVTVLKGGLGVNKVTGVNYDERRFGQFALRLIFTLPGELQTVETSNCVARTPVNAKGHGAESLRAVA